MAPERGWHQWKCRLTGQTIYSCSSDK